ncbi:MAG: transporter [Syntrophales bacterium]|nr:transporter [Syntrophales bacterium]
MTMKSAGIVTVGLILILIASAAFAAHPLITDDTGTQGKGKYQLEANIEYAHNDDLGVKSNETQAAATLTYGLLDNLDVTVGLPWLKEEEESGNAAATERGVSDLCIWAKWRFYERESLSFAFRPGVTLPTGNEGKGLGRGKTTYSLFFITTREWQPIRVHLNLGYIRNENKLDERVDIWHVSLAGEFAVTKALRVVLNIGQEKNPDQLADQEPAFILGGLIYAVTESFDVDMGVKRGLNDAEPDYRILAGITYRF